MPLYPTPTRIVENARESLDAWQHHKGFPPAANSVIAQNLAHNLSRTTDALEAALEGLYRCYRNLGEDTDGAKNARELFGPMVAMTDPAGFIAQVIAEQRAKAEREADAAESKPATMIVELSDEDRKLLARGLAARVVSIFNNESLATDVVEAPIPNAHDTPTLHPGPSQVAAASRAAATQVADILAPEVEPERHSNRRIEAAIQNAEKYIAQHDSDIAPGVGSYEVGIMRQLIDALMKTDRGADTAAKNPPRERSALNYEALAQLRQEVLATIHSDRRVWPAVHRGVLERTMMLADTLLDEAHHDIATRANERATEPTLVDGEWMQPAGDPHTTEPPC